MTEPIEPRLQALAKEFQYPITPSVVGAVMSGLREPRTHLRRNRQLAWALAMIIVLLAGLMSVPPVRAAVLEFIQIGIVRIFPAPAESPVPTTEAPLTPAPAPTRSSLIPMIEKIAGETTLESARSIVNFSIPLPTYPPDLGPPDRVFLQDTGGWMVILVWLNPQQPEHVQMSLHLIEADGQRAIWTVGEYPLIMRHADIQFVRLIDGNVLIWEENKITHRLETDLALDEAIRIAESLQVPPIP